MYRSTMFLLTLIVGVTTVGCAKNSGSIVSNDPFASGGDPFRAVANHSDESNTTQTAKAPTSRQSPGWSRTDANFTPSGTTQAAGLASTGSSLRFQASAPMPEITAEKPAPHKPMPVAPIQTFESTPNEGIQQAQYLNDQTSTSGVAPASFESSMPAIRPRNSAASEVSPVTLEMPVFADEAESSPATDRPTTAAHQRDAVVDDEWWNN